MLKDKDATQRQLNVATAPCLQAMTELHAKVHFLCFDLLEQLIGQREEYSLEEQMAKIVGYVMQSASSAQKFEEIGYNIGSDFQKVRAEEELTELMNDLNGERSLEQMTVAGQDCTSQLQDELIKLVVDRMVTDQEKAVFRFYFPRDQEQDENPLSAGEIMMF